MKSNLSFIDKATRIALALVIVVLYLAGVIDGTIAIVLSGLSAVLILTSVTGFCPLYRIFGISTLRYKSQGPLHRADR